MSIGRDQRRLHRSGGATLSDLSFGGNKHSAVISSSGERLDTHPSLTPPLPLPDGSQILPVLRWPAVRDRAVLFQLSGAEPGAVFSISQSGTVVGRAATSDIVVQDGAVSWEHAVLTVKSDGVYVEDLRSLNGTFVNDQ